MTEGYTRIVLIGTDEQIKLAMQEYKEVGIEYIEVDNKVKG